MGNLTAVLVFTFMFVFFLIIVHFSKEKCPKCGKRGGIYRYYDDRYEEEGLPGEAFNVTGCKKCGFKKETYLGETRDCGNL